jgi:hypothetical protein
MRDIHKMRAHDRVLLRKTLDVSANFLKKNSGSVAEIIIQIHCRFFIAWSVAGFSGFLKKYFSYHNPDKEKKVHGERNYRDDPERPPADLFGPCYIF